MTEAIEQSAPTDHEAFYAELIERNRGLISNEWQAKLRRTRFFIAGCGSTGGACVMPLIRSGAENLVLLDPGSYELNNLNRQDATLGDVGMNKAVATKERVLAVNPFATIEAYEDGVTTETIGARIRPGDIVIDAVDVTTEAGVRAKYALHEAACRLRLKVVTAYDIAATQFIELFDYERVREPLDGRVDEPLTPDGVLRSLIPPRVLPREIFAELRARRNDPTRGFPQLVMTSTLFGAIAVPYLLRVMNGEPVKTRLRVDLYDAARPLSARVVERMRRNIELISLWRSLR